MAFGILFIIPFFVIAAAFFYFKKKITLKEFLIQVAIQVVVAGISCLIMYQSNVRDTEVWSGVVTGKEKNRVSCSHSYSCNCREECSGSGDNRRCSQVCDTCYEHSYDVDWDVYTNINRTFSIDRIDRQGVDQPPRWTKVKVGEPVVDTKSYVNYIKGSKHTIFRREGFDKKYDLPEYPKKVYDYYHLNRLVVSGKINGIISRDWNKKLMEINGKLGPIKEVNLIIVITKEKSRDFFYALEQAWLGGKKNDAVVVLSVNNENQFNWVKVMALTQSKSFQVYLEDALSTYNKLDMQVIDIASENILKHYKRKPMKDFEYLKATIKPSPNQLIFSLIMGLICAIIGVFIAHRYDNRRYY